MILAGVTYPNSSEYTRTAINPKMSLCGQDLLPGGVGSPTAQIRALERLIETWTLRICGRSSPPAERNRP